MNDFTLSDKVSDLLEQLENQSFDSILASASFVGQGGVSLILRTGAISRQVSYVVKFSKGQSTYVEIFKASHFYDAATRYFEAVDALERTYRIQRVQQ